MYSFSTCWNSGRHTDGRAMLREIRDLGFEYAELSHGIRLSLLPGILDAVSAGEIKISTLHNFCPLPVGVDKPSPNLYEFSSERTRERELALKYTFKTFECAKRVNAQLVVLHLGSMNLKDYGGKLEAMLERGEKDSPKYAKLLAEAIAKRDILGCLSTNQKFHFTLYQASGSETLMPLIESLWLQCGPTLYFSLLSPSMPWDASAHTEILDGLRAGKPSVVQRALARDVRTTAKNLLGGAVERGLNGPLMRSIAEMDAFF